MYITVNKNDRRPIWIQIVDQVIELSMSGKLHPGERLPPSRELAHQIGVSRSSVQIAYEELQARGYVTTFRRGGTRISSMYEAFDSRPERDSQPVMPQYSLLQEASERVNNWLPSHRNQQIDIDFRLHDTFIDSAFQQSWHRAFNRASKRMKPVDWGPAPSYGLSTLRDEIRNYLAFERGIHVKTEQILLTSGARQSMDLITQGLLKEGELVSVEDPGFPAAWASMVFRKMNVECIPVDDQGIVVNQISPLSKLIFVTPSHQCATGVLLSAQRRSELLDVAVRNRAWIIEDDYDGEFRYRGGPLPTLLSQNHTNVLYLLSFSKTLAAGVRISAIVGPESAIERLAKLQDLLNRHLSIMEQYTLEQFIVSGDFMKHIRRVRSLYYKRHRKLIKSLAAYNLGSLFTFSGTETGLHVLLEADQSFDEFAVVYKALEKGVGIFPLSPYCFECNRKGILLGFANVESSLIEEGVKRLAEII